MIRIKRMAEGVKLPNKADCEGEFLPKKADFKG